MKEKGFRKKFMIFGGIAVLILLLGGLYFARCFAPEDFSAHLLKVYRRDFEVIFPDGTSEKFHTSTEQGPHGEYTAYAVYDVTGDYGEFLKDFDEGHRPDIESGFLEKMDQLEIPVENRPDFNQPYYARHKGRNDGDHLYLVFDGNTKQLYTLLIFR